MNYIQVPLKPGDPLLQIKKEPEKPKRRVFIKYRGDHKSQFYGLVYEGGDTCMRRLVKNQRVASEQVIEIPEGIDTYVHQNRYQEITKEVNEYEKSIGDPGNTNTHT